MKRAAQSDTAAGSLTQIYLPSGFQKFRTKAECEEYVRKIEDRRTNPDFPELKQLITVLVTWSQVERYIVAPINHTAKMKYERRRTLSADEQERNVYFAASSSGKKESKESKASKDSYENGVADIIRGIRERLALPFHRQLTPIDAVHTLRYLFFHLKCGIYVKIHDNRLAMFVPFANRDFRNTWSEYLYLDTNRYRSLDEYYGEKARFYRRENVLSDLTQWWCNGAVICNEYSSQVWGDALLPGLLDMLLELCATRTVPDVDFFINKRDHPQLKRNLTDPNDDLFPRADWPLSRERYERYAPICSFYGSSRFADILVPCVDDWEAATGMVFPRGTDLYSSANRSARGPPPPWDQRIATCFFRGTATGGGTTRFDNQRIHAAHLSAEWAKDPRYNEQNKIGDGVRYLDAALTSWNMRDKKLCGRPMVFTRPPEQEFELGSFVPVYEQRRYKYLLYIPGHSASARYSYLMTTGCTIFKVDAAPSSSAGQDLWFFPLLQPMVDHIPVKADLSDLAERITWAKQHDKECQQIAANCQLLHQRYLSKNGILDYWQFVTHQIAERFAEGEPPVKKSRGRVAASSTSSESGSVISREEREMREFDELIARPPDLSSLPVANKKASKKRAKR